MLLPSTDQGFCADSLRGRASRQAPGTAEKIFRRRDLLHFFRNFCLKLKRVQLDIISHLKLTF